MDGIGRVKGLSFQTSDGSFGTPAGATLPDDYGCISFDHRWWRLWFKMIDIDSSSAARFFVFPAHTTSLDGGTDDGTLTGAFIGWGANLTNSSSLLNYEPAPSYSIDIEQRRFGRRNARRSWVR